MENNNGYEQYIKNPKEFIDKVRDLCFTNDINVFFRDEEDFYGISMISKTSDKGCILEYSKYAPEKKPFILDIDESSISPTRDCPTVEECFLRFYELNEIFKFNGDFDRNKVLSLQVATRRLNSGMIKTKPEQYAVDDFLKLNKERYLESSQIHFKSAFNWALEEVMATMSKDEEFKNMAVMLKQYIELKYVPGVDNAIENLQRSKKCFEDIANMINE